MKDIAVINAYHAHVYYDAVSVEQAKELCEQAGAMFSLPVGYMHRQAVGPHPMWSCQLSVSVELFTQVIPWLVLNRNGLTVFVHADTGDDLRDHRDYAFWMGEQQVLDLSIFNSAS
jgi:DOPA 4,5-dioxygenase